MIKNIKVKGETLVEVMVSLSIIAIAITSVYSAMILANKLVFTNKYRTQALSLANEASDIAYSYIKNCGSEGSFKVNNTKNNLEKDPSPINPLSSDIANPLPKVETGSVFGRYITIKKINGITLKNDEKILGIDPSDYYEITVYVDWIQGNNYQRIKYDTLVGPSS